MEFRGARKQPIFLEHKFLQASALFLLIVLLIVVRQGVVGIPIPGWFLSVPIQCPESGGFRYSSIRIYELLVLWVEKSIQSLSIFLERHHGLQEAMAMSLSIETKPIPLAANADGVVRVGKTRVMLDTVVVAFQEGATAEEIVYQYPALDLADVYSVIGYYLRQRSEVEEYLQDRQQKADIIRRQNESRFPPQGVRERLLARRRSGDR